MILKLVSRDRNFRHLGFIIQDNMEFIEDVTNRIKE